MFGIQITGDGAGRTYEFETMRNGTEAGLAHPAYEQRALNRHSELVQSVHGLFLSPSFCDNEHGCELRIVV